MEENGSFTAARRKGLTASELKYIAIFAMLCDHIAYLFVPPDMPLYGIMRMIGRITAPTMCFFISEGYHYTHSLKKYFLRLGVFAVISHFAFAFAFQGGFLVIGKESVIATLFLALIAIHIYNTEKIKKAFKLPLILFVLYLSERCDWGMDAVLFALAFEFARGKKEDQLLAYGLVAVVRRILPLIYASIKNIEILEMNWYKIGVLIPIALLWLYNGKKGGSKNTKWVFYIFYPAHLLLLGYLNWKYCS